METIITVLAMLLYSGIIGGLIHVSNSNKEKRTIDIATFTGLYFISLSVFLMLFYVVIKIVD